MTDKRNRLTHHTTGSSVTTVHISCIKCGLVITIRDCCCVAELQDVCVKNDFDDLYIKLTDAGRELKVIHGGVVGVSYQPVTSVRHITNTQHPFGAQALQKPQPQAPQDTAQVC